MESKKLENYEKSDMATMDIDRETVMLILESMGLNFDEISVFGNTSLYLVFMWGGI